MAIGIGIGISLDNGKVTVAPTPPANFITITTTLTGDFNIDLDGVGTCVITWPDLMTSNVVMTGSGAITTTKTITPGTITISNPAILTYFGLMNWGLNTYANEVTSITGLEYCTLIQTLIISGLFASLTTYSTWTDLSTFVVHTCPSLTSITTHPEWVLLSQLYINYCDLLTTVTTYPQWVNLSELDVEYCSAFTGIITRPEWTALTLLSFYNLPLLTSITTYPEWVALESIDIDDNPLLTSITTHAEWVLLSQIWILNCIALTTVIFHSEWVVLNSINLTNDNLTESSINNSLITVFASGMTSGIFDLRLGTNAAPTGAGITAADSLNAAGVIVTANGYTWP